MSTKRAPHRPTLSPDGEKRAVRVEVNLRPSVRDKLDEICNVQGWTRPTAVEHWVLTWHAALFPTGGETTEE